MSSEANRAELGKKLARQLLILTGQEVEARAALIIEGYLDMIYNEGWRAGQREAQEGDAGRGFYHSRR